MYVYQKVRARNFARAWGYIQVDPLWLKYQQTRLENLALIMSIAAQLDFHTSKTVSAAYSEYKAPLKHSLKGAVAINIEMHNVYQEGWGIQKQSWVFT